jgi:predicted transposase/invertase (TIGR01784 family)
MLRLPVFSHPQPEGENNMTTQYKNPMVNRALDSLRALSADQKTRELAERREKAVKDEAMFLNEARRKGLEEGLEKGLEKGKKETALNLLRANLLPMDQIAEVTGLEIAEIEKLKRSLL